MRQNALSLFAVTIICASASAYLLDDINTYSHACLDPAACQGCGFFAYGILQVVSNFRVYCTSASLAAFPSINPVNITYRDVSVDFSDNLLTSVPNNAFANINLKSKHHNVELKLGSNNISSIDINAFSGVSSFVTSLDLSNNNLSVVPDAVGKLQNIKRLSLQGNPLRSLDANVMNDIGNSLTSLQFSMDSMSSWPQALHSLVILRYLTVSSITTELNDPALFDGFANTLYEFHLLYSNPDHGPNFHIIPLAVTHLKRLNTLNILGRVYCTCSLAYLKGWHTPLFVLAEGKGYFPCHNSRVHVDDYIYYSLPQCP